MSLPGALMIFIGGVGVGASFNKLFEDWSKERDIRTKARRDLEWRIREMEATPETMSKRDLDKMRESFESKDLDNEDRNKLWDSYYQARDLVYQTKQITESIH